MPVVRLGKYFVLAKLNDNSSAMECFEKPLEVIDIDVPSKIIIDNTYLMRDSLNIELDIESQKILDKSFYSKLTDKRRIVISGKTEPDIIINIDSNEVKANEQVAFIKDLSLRLYISIRRKNF